MTGPLVEVQDLWHVYSAHGEEMVALRDQDLELAAGEKVAVVGPSGSGKTTLLNVLAGLVAPQAGLIRVAGFDLARLSESERHAYRRAQVGYVWQRARHGLWPQLTALENVQLPMVGLGGSAQQRHDQALQLLASLRLDPYVAHLPPALGYEETQRLALAVALANRPRLLLADELTSELDLASSDRLLEDLDPLLKRLGTAAILVTHDVELERYVDRMIPMRLARPLPPTGGGFQLRNGRDPAAAAALSPQQEVLVADSLTAAAQPGDPPDTSVRGASFTVRQSEFVAIAGRSGSGKSTLLKLCGGLRVPDSGRLVIRGQDLSTLRRGERELVLQKQVGWVLANAQPPLLVTAGESVELTARIGGATLPEARSLSELAMRLTGLVDRAGYPLSRLSGGEQQRVALARAMVKGPALIIADEPTAQLDAVTANGILALLREVADTGVAVLLATHEPMVAEVADRVLVMENGELRNGR